MTQAILLSGGMDSVALAFWKRPTHAITIDYGQLPAPGEIRASLAVCNELGMRHHVVSVNCRALGSGDLAGSPAAAVAPVSEWWPFRNQMLVTLACMKAIQLGVTEVMVGSVKSDSIHTDGSAQFYESLDLLVGMQEGKLKVSVPAITKTTVELVKESRIDWSLLAWSHSCHVAEFACGRCRGCSKRNQVIQELGHGDELLEVS